MRLYLTLSKSIIIKTVFAVLVFNTPNYYLLKLTKIPQSGLSEWEY